jgi:transposase
VLGERTSVGLDVHARSVVAAAIDGETGELRQARLTSSYEDTRSWITRLSGPVAVAYEAGPTGFGLYRYLTAAGLPCVVAAPSKLQRPWGDRVKTDAKDAVHLARLLRLGELTPVAIPTVEQEAARDLVRAREDCRGDLMRARHRLSKLLLRQGIVYSGGNAWTGPHDRWLRQQRFATAATTLTFESEYDAVLAMKARRDRLDAAITAMAGDSEFTPIVRRLGCPRGVSTLTAFALAVEIGDWIASPGTASARSSGWCPANAPPARRGCRARSPRPATPTPAGCSSKRRGSTARRTGPARPCRIAGNSPLPPHGPAVMPATAGCTNAGSRSISARSGA